MIHQILSKGKDGLLKILIIYFRYNLFILLLSFLNFTNLNEILRNNSTFLIFISIKGQYDDAITIYKEIEKVQLDVLGPTHPDHLTTKHNIAHCLDSKGKFTSLFLNLTFLTTNLKL